jgi:hypothetical protein
MSRRRGPRLVGIPPIGLGTPAGESLSSYFLRLAAAHQLLPRDLARYVVDAAAWARTSDRAYTQVVSRGRSTMNGPGDAGEAWANMIGALTDQRDLELMTMVPWRGRVSLRGLMSPVRRFCPSCYWDWQEAKEPSRELLLWALSDVTHCPTHDIRLTDRCERDDCRRIQSHLGSIARTGRCYWCDESLASSPITERSEPELPGEQAWARFVADQVGAVVADGARARSETMPIMTITMARMIERAGGTMALSVRTGLSQATVAGWRSHVPTLGHLLHLSASLEVSASDLMRGDQDPRRVLNWAAPLGGDRLVSRRVARRRIDWPLVEHKLQLALTAPEALPQRTVMARIGVDPSAARKRYPALCHELSRRAARARNKRARERANSLKSDLQATVADLNGQGIYASRRQVEAKLPHLSLREPALGAAWREILIGPVALSPRGVNGESRSDGGDVLVTKQKSNDRLV